MAPHKEFDINEIDNLYDELIGSSIVEVDEIEDLLGEYVSGVLETVDADIESAKDAETPDRPAVLEFFNAQPETVLRAELFHPNTHELSILDEQGNLLDAFALTELSCLRTAHIPMQFSGTRDRRELEVVETLDGKTFRAEIPVEQSHADLLFGFTTEHDTPWKYLFFPHPNIRQRSLDRYLGDILVAKGMIDAEAMGKARETYEKYKNLRLETIVAGKAGIPPDALKEAMHKALKSNPNSTKLSQILLATGLVSKELLQAAIQTRARLKKQKIGHFLIQRNLLGEEQVYDGLSEKFRMPVVDIRKLSLSTKLIKSFPEELIKVHEVLPLSFQDSLLSVATTRPENTALKEVISQRTQQKNIRVSLILPSQFELVMKKLFSQ